MKVRIFSQNVQGLTDPLAPSLLRHYYADKFSQMDILYIQEHKLRNLKLSQLGAHVWKEATFINCVASPTYNHSADDAGAGNGGVGMFIAPRLSHMLHLTGSVGINRAQWATFHARMSKRTTYGNFYRLNVHFIKTSTRVREYSVDGFLPSAPTVKKASVQTLLALPS
jgi:exonuclease III